MKSPLAFLLLCLAMAVSADDAVFGDNFQRGALDRYLDGSLPSRGGVSLVTEPGVTGRVMKLAAPVQFRLVPVHDSTRYELAFRARQQGAESIEENPRLAELLFDRRSFLPGYQLRFFDSDRKEIRPGFPSLAIPFGQWREVRYVFYPPQGAASMRLEFSPGDAPGNAVHLANATLGPAADEGAINVNPAFKLGPFNYSGWGAFNVPGGVGRLHVVEGGRTVLDSGFSATSLTFPLREPGTYRVSCSATGNERSYVCFLVLLNAEGREVARIGEPVFKPKSPAKDAGFLGSERHFVLPPGAVRGYFLVYHSVLAEVAVTRVGGAEEFQKFNK